MMAPPLSSSYKGDDDDNLYSVSVEGSPFQYQGASQPVTSKEPIYHHERNLVGTDTLGCPHTCHSVAIVGPLGGL